MNKVELQAAMDIERLTGIEIVEGDVTNGVKLNERAMIKLLTNIQTANEYLTVIFNQFETLLNIPAPTKTMTEDGGATFDVEQIKESLLRLQAFIGTSSAVTKAILEGDELAENETIEGAMYRKIDERVLYSFAKLFETFGSVTLDNDGKDPVISFNQEDLYGFANSMPDSLQAPLRDLLTARKEQNRTTGE